ncbi:MAG: cyclic nucleotide-binding domain-containing protein [Planctomycetota bacterium]|nr:cyclic nucleotide-binding domain-containing protein [Planctomycetota bacterium]
MTSTAALTAAQRVQALGACPVFSSVPPGDLGVLAEMMQTEYLLVGEILFESGDPSDRTCVVVSGRLAILLPGRSDPVRRLGPGELLGEYGMLAGSVRTASVRAEADTVLLSLDYRRFRAFLIHFPETMFVLFRTAVQRLIALEQKGEGASSV